MSLKLFSSILAHVQEIHSVVSEKTMSTDDGRRRTTGVKTVALVCTNC